ncbi:acetyl-CoA-benzylalcohol acetyltransferase-like [Lycium ferocissimum]|uniref:acetyl-CoA-benzylalcohol acetyltransferase-like n=1 Tax=Lycium ferocissimum TaxID=112874 RepID=UPI002815D7BC|nr:acetyl-CoA-benzylalcohol acetyltransferase-like [Lycium ferocissimum]
MVSLCVNFSDQIQVEIMSKKLIKPSSPTPNHLQNYKLSFFDQIVDKTHMPVVLFYPHPINSSTTTNFMVQQLEESLSRILTHVYPAAGRFAQDKCSINCLDQGVTLIKAKVNCLMDDFLQEASTNFDLALNFWPQGIKDVDATSLFTTPLMVVQIAIFQCGGLALSMSTAHPAMDGWASFTFIYEWSRVCKLGMSTEKINFMSFDLANVFGPRDVSTMFEASAIFPGLRPDAKIVAKNFVMDEVSLSKLRDKLTNCKNPGALSFKPSRVEMVTAILWRAQLRASQAITGKVKPSLMSFPLNLRGKLKYPETTNPYGNFVIEVPIAYEPKGTNMDLKDFIILIREAVQKTVDYCGEASTDEVVDLVANLYNQSYGGQDWGTSDDIEEFTCSSLCRFHMQEADFGWGNPNLMHFGSRHHQVFWLYSTQCGNSIAVQMDLKENYLHFIERDLDFLAFTKF